MQSKSWSAEWLTVFLTAATSLGFFVVQLDVSIVNLCLPSMQKFFHVDIHVLQWFVNIYTLTFAVLLLSAGTLGDRYGNKRFLIIGYVIFLIGSLACGIAPNTAFMLTSRAAQGIGAAMIIPNSLAVLSKGAANKGNLRTVLITIWMSFGGAALACGPILGGIITSLASWRYIFLINIPACLLGITLTKLFAAPDVQLKNNKNDLVGQVLLLIFATTLLVLITNLSDLDRASRVLFLAPATISLILFFLWERRCPNPMLPLSVLRNLHLQQAIAYGSWVHFVYLGIIFFSSIYFRYGLKLTPLQSGLAFIPITAPLIAANIISGKISTKYSPIRSINVGFFFLIAGMLLLAMPFSTGSYKLMLPGFVLLSLGVGLIVPMIISIAVASIHESQSGMMAAVVNFCRHISGAFGVAIFGALPYASLPQEFHNHFSKCLAASAVVMLVGIAYFNTRLSRHVP